MNFTNVSQSEDGTSGWANLTWKGREWIQVIYIIVAILGTFGNLLVLRVYLSSSMGVHLAMTDLITSVLILPFKVITYPVPSGLVGEILCRVFISQYFLWTSGLASVYILLFVTIDRLIAITKPLKYKRIMTARRANLCCMFSWLLAAAIQCYEFVSFNNDGVGACGYTGGIATVVLVAYEGVIVVSLTFFMLGAYTHIGITIGKSPGAAGKQPQDKEANESANKSRRRMTAMMFAVVGVYFAMWILLGVYNIWNAFDDSAYATIGGEIAMLLSIANSMMNPIIYSLTSKKFRRTVKAMLGVKSGVDDETKTTQRTTQVEM